MVYRIVLASNTKASFSTDSKKTVKKKDKETSTFIR